jgi:flagellar biosynthesis anti-sigma factor FlgM
MRLHLDNSNAGIAAQTPATPAGKAGGDTSTAGTGNTASLGFHHSDKVSLSGTSSALSASSSDRSARITQLTQAVQNGTYQVSSRAISQSIVASATT